MEEEYRFPTREELEAQKTAMEATGQPTKDVDTLINQRLTPEELSARIAEREAKNKPADKLKAELWMRENGIR